MTVDKRSVHTDALHTLGFIHTQDEGRDAIHLAVEQVTAGSYLNPGAHIGRDADNRYTIRAPGEGLGIVDPFIQGMVRPGDRFWLVVYPRKITSLRHVWSHPDFDDLKSDLPEVHTDPVAEAVMREQIIAEHVALQRKQDVDAAVQWVKKYVAELNDEHYESWMEEDYGSDYLRLTYEELMETADEAVRTGYEYISKGPMFEGASFNTTFWDHYEVIRDVKVPNRDGLIYFSCSC